MHNVLGKQATGKRHYYEQAPRQNLAIRPLSCKNSSGFCPKLDRDFTPLFGLQWHFKSHVLTYGTRHRLIAREHSHLPPRFISD